MATILRALLPERAGDFFLGFDAGSHLYFKAPLPICKWVRRKYEMDAFRDAVSFCLHRCQYGCCKRR
jgi:hypothetical protein